MSGHNNNKRSRQSPEDSRLHSSHNGSNNNRAQLPVPAPPYHHSESSPTTSVTSTSNLGSSSSFRNVSACNRCRLRKNRCDQNLPACASCEKARVKCVGYDPITKREIPRAYVFYLESRVSYLQSMLADHGIAFAPADDFDVGSKPLHDASSSHSPASERNTPAHAKSGHRKTDSNGSSSGPQASPWDEKQEEAQKLNKLVSNIGMVSVQGASDPRYLGSTSGISFARVVFAAVRNSISSSSSDRAGIRPSKPVSMGAAATSGTSMRDSFFGLQSKPSIKQAPFPDRDVGARLVKLYFEHANPQIPILHRGEFMSLFERAYSRKDRKHSPRELYMLNIVFAIGAGIILGEPDAGSSPPSVRSASPIKREPTSPKPKRAKVAAQQHQPEEYHASAMVHLESFLGSTPAADRPEGFGGSLEELQAVLLLAGFALLRPVAPGLWYIVGVAVRLGVDLGLHYEDGVGIEGSGDGTGMAKSQDIAMEATGDSSWAKSNGVDPKERGRREWVRDLRRRLWWCVYSFDRLVSTCVGRPFGITDQVITTEFPSILDDNYITTSGFTAPSSAYGDPSYKRVAHHYFRLRLLQSEILQVLQYRTAQQAREAGRNSTNEYMHTKLSSPYLQGFESFRAWRKNIDRRLWEWKETAPHQKDTTVQFSVQFLELNYWQAVIMLYRESLSVPPVLAGEVCTSEEIASPMSMNTDEPEDDDDIFLKVAEAGQQVLKIYRQLHTVCLVNYTFLATHHLFMAGIAFLYAIWHSETVRQRLTHEQVDYTILAAKSVLGDLIDKCPPAEACRDAFDRMSKATVQMCLSTTGFGLRQTQFGASRITQSNSPDLNQNPQPQMFVQQQNEHGYFRPQRRKPQFDMNLRDLFPEETQEERNFARNLGRWQPQGPLPQTAQPDVLSYQDLLKSPMPPQQMLQQQTPPNFSPASSYDMQGVDLLNNQAYDGYNYTNDIDSLLADSGSNAAYNGHPGFTLGFDSEHDWSEGVQLDLFDGFFFGGGGVGSANGGVTN